MIRGGIETHRCLPLTEGLIPKPAMLKQWKKMVKPVHQLKTPNKSSQNSEHSVK